MKDRNGTVNATGIDGSNLIVFDGADYLETISREVERLYKINPDMAKYYSNALSGGIRLTIENCNPSYDNSHRSKE